MKTIKHILFPTDFSPNAENALPYALELACQFGADITLFHAIEEPYDFASVVEEYKGKLTKKVEEHLKAKIEEIKQMDRYKHIEVHFAIRLGKVVRAILEETERDEIDFIVMGTKGATGMSKVLFGSNAADVILLADVPVLAVPEKAKIDGMEHLTYTTDYHESDLDSMTFIIRLAEKFDSSIYVVHVSPDDNFESKLKFKGFKEMVKEIKLFMNIHFDHVFADDFFEGLKDYTTENNSDMIIMTRNKRTFFRNLFESSYSSKLSFYTEIPLLVLV